MGIHYVKRFWGDEDFGPYRIMMAVYIMFIAVAVWLEPLDGLLEGLYRILTSRSILITDYMEIGGIGATLLNSVLVGSAGIYMLRRAHVRPTGSIIMALWLTTGFSFFGKNLFNMIPITFGVWLYARVQKKPFAKYALAALLSATISPVVSEISFLGILNRPVCLGLGILTGIAAGFVFPGISKFCLHINHGYNLYNMGFAGGLISSFILAFLQSVGLEVESVLFWSTGNNLVLSLLMYGVSMLLISYGYQYGDRKKLFWSIWTETDKDEDQPDYFGMFGFDIYMNMGLLCAFGTTVVLLLGADLNGPTISGILTMAGFGAFGKHLKNVLPLVSGAVLCTFVNLWDTTSPSNILAVLFASGLAPIAGKFGFGWGVAAGFAHVTFVHHISYLNSGMNLYNNGFAAGFVALFLVPAIVACQKAYENSVQKRSDQGDL